MLIVPDHVIILPTPRTGSRALEKCFVGGISTQWDANGEVRPREQGRIHHVHPEDVDEVAEKFSPGSSRLPKVTVCRHPANQLLSWYHHIHVNHVRPENRGTLSGFMTFIKEADISWYFTPTLNPYQFIATEIFPYKRNGLDTASAISRKTGAPIKMEAPVIGASTGLDSTWLANEEVKQAIADRFQADLDLYESLYD